MIDANTPPPMTLPLLVDGEGLNPRDADPVEPEKLPMVGGWTAREALSVVMADFQRAETDRSTNHETRWTDADNTYLAWSPIRNVWEGTRQPRSNMQIFTAYENVEALIPQVLDALFGGDLDFDVQPGKAGTTFTQAQQVRDLLNYQFKSLGGSQTDFVSLRETTRRVVKSAFIYGNGIVEWGWEGPYQTTRTEWTRSQVPEMQAATHPMYPGMTVHLPTGRTQEMVHQQEVPDVVSQLLTKWVGIRDFYIDPNCPSGNVQEAGYCLHRQLMTMQELLTYRDRYGFDVPDDATLLKFAKNKQTTPGDSGKSQSEGTQGRTFQPTTDQSIDPKLARLEVIRYWQKGRHVWVLNRRHVMWNGKNHYGALPFLNTTYTDVLGRFYGLSICDITRGDQKLIKTLVDGRLDELNLILHPPTLTKRGAMRSTSMMRLSPGRNWEVDNPKEDVLRMEMGNVTQSAFTEVDSAERRVQKKTGVTDLAVMGVPTSGGNSANRTATGVQAQTNASNSRVHSLVATFEDTVMKNLLAVALNLTQKYMDPQQVLKIIGPAGDVVQLDPLAILNADVRFEMQAAMRMKARAGMQGGGLNTFMQFVLNPETMKLLGQQQGKVVDIDQVMAMFCDTYNMRSTSFVRPMSPQEQQMMMQQQNGPMQAKMQMQESRIQQMSQDAHERDETAIIVAVVNALARVGALNQVLGVERDVELKMKQIEAA